MIEQITNSIDIGHIILVIISLIGGTYSIIQSRKLRKYQILDRNYEKRHAAYSKFITKLDELQNGLRPSLSETFKTPENYFEKMMIAETEEDTVQAFLGLNTHMIKYMDKALEPVLIIKGEINSLYLDSSDEMVTMIDRYKELADTLHTNTSNTLNLASPTNIEQATSRWNEILEMGGWQEMADLGKKMIAQMRKEIQGK
jgi:Mg2+ and Co2+ transporter CorA